MSLNPPLIDSKHAPSLAQLSFALAILKLKPSHASLEDYLTYITSQIRAGRRTRRSFNNPKHLDSVALWKQAYEKSEDVQAGLRNRIYELERSLEALNGKARPGSLTPVRPNARKRRGREPDTPDRFWNPMKRRATTSNTTVCRELRSLSEALPEPDIPEVKSAPDYSFVMRHLYDLQLSMTMSQLDHPKLVYSITAFCSDADAALSHAVKNGLQPSVQGHTTPSRPQSCQEDVIQACRVLERSLPTVLHAHRAVASMHPTNSKTRFAVYATIRLLSSLVTHIHNIALRSSQMIPNDPEQITKVDPSESCTIHIETIAQRNTPVLRRLSEVLSRVLSWLASPQYNHATIFEGFFAVFLSHLGRILSLFVFGVDAATESAAEPADHRFPRPQLLCEEGVDHPSLMRAAEVETSFLVPILRQAMQVAKVSPASAQLSTRSPYDIRHSQSGEASEQALGRLQRTLLKGIFGPEDDVSRDSLQEPEVLERPDDTAAQEEPEDRREWFKREVWALLGWDVLATEFGANH